MVIGSGLKDILDEIKTQRIKVYHVLSFPLDSIRTDFELYVTGNYLYILGLAGSASIRLNELSSDSIDLFKSRQIQSPFYRIYLSNAAQAGLTLTLAVGVQSEYFQISDYQAPDLSLMSGYMQQLRDSFAYAYGTQVAKSSTANCTTVIIHAVTDGKTFILDHYSFQGCAVTGGGVGQFFITDGADVWQYTISTINLQSTGNALSGEGNPSLAIPAGYKIKLNSSTVGHIIYAFIKGREI